MPRGAFIALCLVVAAIPFLLFGALAGQGRAQTHGSRFFFVDLDSDEAQRGRGYSSGGFQGGGFHLGK